MKPNEVLMAVINADIEQIWQRIEALSPEDREIIRVRLARKRLSKSLSTTSPTTPLENEIFKISFAEYLALSDEKRASIRTFFYTKYRDWIDDELQRRQAEWMLVVGGRVIETGQLDEYPSREKLYKTGHYYRLIPFVFVANPLIEESSWLAHA
jgi:hypothetical protein